MDLGHSCDSEASGAGPVLSYVAAARDVDGASIHNPLRLRAVEYVEFPLWDAEEWLGDDFDWLHENLGLSWPSYEALTAWQAQFDELSTDSGAASELEERKAEHRETGAQLAARLSAELAPRFEVVLTQ
jgi:hypothetical protein